MYARIVSIVALVLFFLSATAKAAPPQPRARPAIVTPNGSSLPLRLVDGVKVGHLIAEEIEHELAPGIRATVWGYNGSVPGPTIEAEEGDRLRIYVENRLPAPTTVHWHGLVLPAGMDGVSGLTQPPIPPGKVFVYDFVLNRAGTYMYHPHHDEMTQIAMGMAGMFIVHPAREPGPAVDHDFVLMTHEWRVPAGAAKPDANEMSDFNLFTFNGKAYPATEPLRVGRGERVRIRIGNLSPTDHHPIHVHGLAFELTATDGGYVPPTARIPETTVLVPVGTTRVIEMVPEEPGAWAVHCHMTHHTMTQMGHIPSLVGARLSGVEVGLRELIPGAMIMGTTGMGEMSGMRMALPANSAPMLGGHGAHGTVDMGGMFTVLEVTDDDGSWRPAPDPAGPPSAEQLARDGIVLQAK